MKITLGSGDGGLYSDGLPRLVILNITTDAGALIQLPYPTDRTLMVLFADMARYNPATTEPKGVVAHEGASGPASMSSFVSDPARIQRGDIVRSLVDMVPPPDDGNPQEIFKDREYRVIDVYEQTLEVIDDTSDHKRRLPMLKTAVELVRKGVVAHQTEVLKEQVVACAACRADVALILRDGAYRGVCGSCGNANLKESSVA